MRTRLTATTAGIVASVLCGSAAIASGLNQTDSKSDEQRLTVTVTYKGKGAVDDNHEVFVFLFENPDIGPGSAPIAVQAVRKNGGTASFSGVSVSPVYVAVAYDEKGDYEGTTGPPPPGTPIAIYVVKGESTPAPVRPGKSAKIKLTFDDSRRMQGASE
jgi:hypothetical protein